jgi:hypothetical protein
MMPDFSDNKSGDRLLPPLAFLRRNAVQQVPDLNAEGVGNYKVQLPFQFNDVILKRQAEQLR